MPKNTFFEGTKKFYVEKIFWDFLYMYKGGLCKKNTAAKLIINGLSVLLEFLAPSS